MLHQKCLSDGRIASYAPLSLHTFPTLEFRGLCPTVSATFRNRQPDIHFMLWLVSCPWGERGARVWTPLSRSFTLLHISCLSLFMWNNRVQHYECLPAEAVWKCASLSPYLNHITSALFLWQLPFHPAFKCGRLNHKHFWQHVEQTNSFQAWSCHYFPNKKTNYFLYSYGRLSVVIHSYSIDLVTFDKHEKTRFGCEL